tara:strand:+ start:22 stop:474 length:453 start_codon:yes stop_codon:yes gene_type:complete
MQTEKQKLGKLGEDLVRKSFSCLKCKRELTLRPLITNFKCADLICDFCGYLAQVKTKRVKDVNEFPKSIPGAAWAPQKERMDAGIFFSIFFVLVNKLNSKEYTIWYLASELQNKKMFMKRKPLSKDAKRAGWQGYFFNKDEMKDYLVKLK